MKRIATFTGALLLTLGLAACGETEAEKQEQERAQTAMDQKNAVSVEKNATPGKTSVEVTVQHPTDAEKKPADMNQQPVDNVQQPVDND